MCSFFSRQGVECGDDIICKEEIMKNVEQVHACKLTETNVKMKIVPVMKNKNLTSFVTSKNSK